MGLVEGIDEHLSTVVFGNELTVLIVPAGERTESGSPTKQDICHREILAQLDPGHTGCMTEALSAYVHYQRRWCSGTQK